MAIGRRSDTVRTSPILMALAKAEQGASGEIRVHLTRRWLERDAFKRAAAIFREFDMGSGEKRGSVLVYVNLRRRRFAIVADEELSAAAGQKLWDRLARELAIDLRSTHHENAVALTVARVGEAIRKHFPSEG
jgi:uncharacterized membrane protein